MRVILKNLD